jgi:hypothetical protein
MFHHGDIDTLKGRLRDEMEQARAVFAFPALTCAWAVTSRIGRQGTHDVHVSRRNAIRRGLLAILEQIDAVRGDWEFGGKSLCHCSELSSREVLSDHDDAF